MQHRMSLALLSTAMMFGASVPAVTVSAAETEAEPVQAAAEAVKPRTIVTTDLECDDMDSLIHMALFFNDIDIDGIVVSASQFHFTGDGEHTLSEVTEHYACEDPDAANLKSFRAMPVDWAANLWENEYAAVYDKLAENDPNYPTPEYLESVTKIGNVEFEGDVREDTEGSDLIKNAILDDEPGPLYLLTWGGFNTTARALLSIHDEYGDTDQWDSIYQKVIDKVIVNGYSQDYTYQDYIRELYPDLKLMKSQNGYAGYFAARTAQADALYTFQADWLKENIKFNHGALLEKYGLMGDGTHYENEPDNMQYGETTTIDWHISFIPAMTFDQYDFMAEGDSGTFLPLINVGLRGLEDSHGGTYGGPVHYITNDTSTGSFADSIKNGEEVTGPYNYVNGKSDGSLNRFLLAYQEEWAARADWCVNDYASCNHAPVVALEQKDYTAAPGESVQLDADVSDPDGNTWTTLWSWYSEGSSYSGIANDIRVWDPTSDHTSFTVPADAQEGDVLVLTVAVRDNADAPMTRYDQAIITVTAPAVPDETESELG